ncbi:BQ2448_5148 [Microbotryum intermedium]|uniref:BQ2448_5148 protein n=1 Tax=Microbotryum intermedium TaxID=269621 RepID=A0A238F3A7_9BASI|nr:BQ2448_5148 [Microbotryum intermedium]
MASYDSGFLHEASKRRQAFGLPRLVPEGHQKIFSFPAQRWHSWWKALRKVLRVHSDADSPPPLTGLPPPSRLTLVINSQPANNRRGSSVGRPPPLGPLSLFPHPVFGEFVCPLVSRSECRLVEHRNLFFHSI